MPKKMIHAIKEHSIIWLFILVIPTLVTLMLGYEFSNHQIKHVPMAVVDLDNSSTSRTIIQNFSENDTFDLLYAPQTSEELQDLINTNKIRVGMIIPANFSKDILTQKSPSILMLYDGSYVPIASVAKTKATEILLTVRTGASIKLMEAKLSLPEDVAKKTALDIQFVQRKLYNPASSFLYFLCPGLAASMVQTCLAFMGAAAIPANDIRKRRRMRRPLYVVSKIIYLSILGVISLFVSLGILNMVYGVPFRGSVSDALVLCALFSVSVASFSVLVSALISDKPFATAVNAVLFIPSAVIVGYTYPLIAMPDIYSMIAYFMPFAHFAANIRSMLLTGAGLGSMNTDVTWFIIYSACSMLGAILVSMIYRTEKETQ